MVTWSQYRDSIGDRSGLFHALAGAWPIDRALYPGSYVDLSPSAAIASVTYVDNDIRAARFFADSDVLRAELAGRTSPGSGVDVRFLAADYTQDLDVLEGSMDLLISLYAGPVWEHAHRYLRPGGWLLANTSHGDASLAALDESLRLVAAVHVGAGHHRLVTDRLDEYLIPKRPQTADADLIRSSGRGIAYTRPAFAYVFQSH
ncbi:MAG: class I SAM-dependent methyltransferase [Ornithinimicrobium sp.]